jgi:signal transduction histidine kinase
MPDASTWAAPSGAARERRGLRRWVVLAAVAVPLATLLGLQLHALTRLQETAAATQRTALRTYTKAVLRGLEDFYRQKARAALGVPAAIVREPAALAAHFAAQDDTGVRQFFVAELGRDGRSPLRFFAPDGRLLALPRDAPETRAARVAAAPWQLVAEEGGTLEAVTSVVSEQFPAQRVIVRPIVDAAARPVGVAGLVLDEAFVRQRYLPERIEAERSRLPEALRGKVVATVRTGVDGADRPPDAAAGDEVELPFRFVFSDWALAAEGGFVSPEAWARRSLWINLGLSLGMTAVLLSAVGLALRSADRATQLSQMKTEFVSNVSHELRTPLASIRVFGEFLRLGRVTEPEKVREYGEYIEAESGRLTQLVDNLLDFARIDSGRRELRFEDVDLPELVTETLRSFEVRLRQGGFVVAVRAPEGPLPPIWADRVAVVQVLTNLLDNALKYSGTAREVTIELARDAGCVTLSVSDRGPGIEPSEQERIFDKFYRVGSGLVHDAKGSGLGLAIVRHVAEAHGGSATVRSRPGEGSTFRVRWPTHGA